jgi:hypothetical protein
MVAIDVFTVEREKAKQASYGDLEVEDGIDENDAHAPMLGSSRLPPYTGGSSSHTSGHGKGPAAKRRRVIFCLALGLGTIAIAVFIGHKAKDRLPSEWTLDHFKETGANWLSGSAASVATSGGDGSTVRTETGSTFVYKNQL